ncbi:MAG: peptidylprolyl isomerase [Verrucomicrobia bacterium]|jgi:cyclophilin family peptidyl-prolyl cis-trans isomerase|nr:peptidylprolyl isomerase [Verrucomicrobiota bacterium]
MKKYQRFSSLLGMILLAGSLFVSVSVGAAPTDPGVYAVFQTSLGEFVAKLNHEKVPRTVASFVGLAEGDQAWLDFRDGRLREDAYFDGLTFHRVVPGFVIQGGSRNGLGNDGPGYQFKDEFHSELRHSKAGILSMANSGPNTNGSQFFVTLAPTPHLDDKHSVFGEVVEGMDIVTALGKVPVTLNLRTGQVDLPVTAPVIESVFILRLGEEAQAFAVKGLQDPLPVIRSTTANVVRRETGSVEIHWTPKAGTLDYLFATTNFNGWDNTRLQPTGRIGIDSFINQYQMVFFKFFQVDAD